MVRKAQQALPNQQLRLARKERGWTQQEVADGIGAPLALNVMRWERGMTRPSAHYVQRLCQLFGKSASELGLLTDEDGQQQEDISETGPVPSALWVVPYQRNPHFTGRDELLDQLAQQLAVKRLKTTVTRQAILSQPQAIKGLGGIGKTQIALEYAYRSRLQGHSTHTFWINAANLEAIITSFQTLAEQLPSFGARDEKDQHKLIAAILRWLQECQQPWLLIVDNADDLSLIQPYLPQQGHGSILLTTRAHAVGSLAHAIEVGTMGLVEGTQFLLHRSQRLDATDEERNEASNIVIALDGFPLALDQAGAYLEETGCSFGDYLQLYEQHRARLLARRGRQATSYPDSVATTWDLSFQKVEQVHPAAAELLQLCVYLSPDHIPEELLTEAAQWPPMLQQAVADRFTFNELMEALLAFSLVKRLAEERLMSVHRLVQAVQLDRMEPEEQRLWAQRVVCTVNTLFPADPKEKIDSWPLCLRYLEQVQACDSLIQQHGLQMPEAAELLDRAGIYLREHASYSLAEPLFQRALAIAEQQFGPEHLQVASSLYNLGIFYREQGQYEQAEPLYLRALHIREQILGPEHPEVARPLNSLAILYAEQGQYEQSEPLFLRALRIREQALGPEHPHVADLLNNLALLYSEGGKYEQAEPLYLRALCISERTLGPEHPQVADPLNNLARLYREQGQYEQAEPLYLRALCISEQTLGPEHPEVAFPLTGLADLYREQGQYEQAEPLYLRGLRIREQTLGSEHPHVAYSLYGLADLYREQGQYEQAEPLFLRALCISEQAYGPEHPDAAHPLTGLADLYRERGRYEEAEPLYLRSLRIREQALGPKHPNTARSMADLARLYKQRGYYEQARPLLLRACTVFEQRLGPAHPETVRAMNDYRSLLEQREEGKPEEESVPPASAQAGSNTIQHDSLRRVDYHPCEAGEHVQPSNQDSVDLWLQACCERSTGEWVDNSAIMHSYQNWCNAHRYSPKKARGLAQSLTAHGLEVGVRKWVRNPSSGTRTKPRGVCGLRLLS